MNRTNTLFAILFVVAACALIVLSVRPPMIADQSGTGLLPAAQVKVAPDFTLGDFHLQDNAKAQPIVLDFWATWCEPCRDELPQIEALSRRYAGRVGFYGINSSDMPANIKIFARQEGLTFPTLSDADQHIANLYGADEIPLLVVVDTHGKVRAVTVGYDEQVETDLPKVLDALLAEK